MNKFKNKRNCDVITINIGGRIFETFRSTLQKYPDTKLGKMSKNSPKTKYHDGSHAYFFDRNPDLFAAILDFYRYDEIHVPIGYCGVIFKKEMEFWGIELGFVSDCCLRAMFKSQIDLITHKNLKRAFANENFGDEKMGRMTSCKRKLRMIIENPSSSRAAKIYHVFNFLLVVMSISLFYMINSDAFRTSNMRGVNNNATLLTLKSLDIDLSNKKIARLLLYDIHCSVQISQYLCFAFYCLDTAARFWSRQSLRKYFANIFNILDVLAIVAMSLFFGCQSYMMNSKNSFTFFNLLWYLSSAFLLRTFRAVRLLMQFEHVIVLKTALRSSTKELFMMACIFVIGSILFGCIIYKAEFLVKDNFDHVLMGIWWAVITMTTVGYGDIVPQSTLGHVVGSCCAVIGLLLIAMPVAVVASNYSEYHARYLESKLKHGDHIRVTATVENSATAATLQ